MHRAPVVTCAASIVGGICLGALQQPAFHGSAHVVPIYATVLDAAGRLVPGLTQADFSVLDDGVEQPTTVFDNARQPITIVIMLDRSGSMSGNFTVVRDAARQLVATLGDADKARLGSFSQAVRIDPAAFTSDRAELNRILDEDLQAPGPTPLWNATADAMTALAAEPGRRVVLVLSDGLDYPQQPGPNKTFDDVRRQSEADGVMVYAIGLADGCGPDDPPGQASGRGGRGVLLPAAFQRGGRLRPPRILGPPIFVPGLPPPVGPVGPPSGPSDGSGRGSDPFGRRGVDSDAGCSPDKPDPNLAALATASGGGYFELRGTDDLGATFARVADELHRQYLLGFRAPALDGRIHAVEVRLRDQPNLTVHARKTYVAAAEK